MLSTCATTFILRVCIRIYVCVNVRLSISWVLISLLGRPPSDDSERHSAAMCGRGRTEGKKWERAWEEDTCREEVRVWYDWLRADMPVPVWYASTRSEFGQIWNYMLPSIQADQLLRRSQQARAKGKRARDTGPSISGTYFCAAAVCVTYTVNNAG